MKTKQELIKSVSRRANVPQEEVIIILEHLLEDIKETTQSGESVVMRGFGIFNVVQKAEKKARNISTGESVIIPAHKEVKFKPYYDVLSE